MTDDTWDQPTYWRTFRTFVDRVVATRNEQALAAEAQSLPSTVSTPTTPSQKIDGTGSPNWP